MNFLPRNFEDLSENKNFTNSRNTKKGNATILDLYSVDILKNWNNSTIPDFSDDNFRNSEIDLYLKIISLKNRPEQNNQNINTAKYKEYLTRLANVLVNAQGFTLDIGCDDPSNILKLMPNNCRYIGLDPNLNDYKYGVINGMAEFLPFKDRVFDTVMFNTSLDHILDYNLALSEADRVLKNKGVIIISTLVWLNKFELWRDRVHFHHFTPAHIESMLENFSVIQVDCYRYGNDTHRYGAFICALKS